MAPTYRTATQTRRGNRAAFEVHDDFEGLPVRQWRRAAVTAVPPKPAPATKQSGVWRYEQIHGMPKDWNQLPPHNQDLLRAARAGYLDRKPAEDNKAAKEKAAAVMANFMIGTGKRHVHVRKYSSSPRDAANDNGRGRATASESGTKKIADVPAEVSRKRPSPDDDQNAPIGGSHKRQATAQRSSTTSGNVDSSTKSQYPSEIEQEIARLKAHAKAKGEEVDIQIEYQFKVKDPVKARPMVRAIPKPKSEHEEEHIETWQEKRDRRRALFANAKEGLELSVWRAVPRNEEGNTISYLAKRHKNTITLAPKAVAAPIAGPTVIRATVRRIDAAGNPYEQTVTLQDGQTVTDGEIISTSVVPAPTVLERAPLQATPNKRRPPPPKRKGKGPGRGRKKGKLPIPLPARPEPAGAPAAAPTTASAVPQPGAVASVPIPQTTETLAQPDKEMADSPAVNSDDDDGDDGDDDDGDENEDGGGDDRQDSSLAKDQDQEMKDVGESVLAPPVPPVQSIPASGSEGGYLGQSGSSLPLPFPTLNLDSPKLEGSPLKNVVSLTPGNRSPAMSPSLQAANTASVDAMDVDPVEVTASKASPSPLVPAAQDEAPPALSENGSVAQPTNAEPSLQDNDGKDGDVQNASATQDLTQTRLLDSSAPTLPVAVTETITEAIAQPSLAESEQTMSDETPVATAVQAEVTLTAPGPIIEGLAEVAAFEAASAEFPTGADLPESTLAAPAAQSEADITRVEQAEATVIEAPESDLNTVATALVASTADDEDGMSDLLGGLERELDRQAGVDA